MGDEIIGLLEDYHLKKVQVFQIDYGGRVGFRGTNVSICTPRT